MAVICPICDTEEEGMCIHEKMLVVMKFMLIIVGAGLIYISM